MKNEYESNFQYAFTSRYRGYKIPTRIIPVAGNNASSGAISPANANPSDIPIIKQRKLPLKIVSSNSILLKYLLVFFPAYTFIILSPALCRFSAISPGASIIKEKAIFSVKMIPK